MLLYLEYIYETIYYLGKKFKGPDFVQKHIHNKHGEKVEEVKKEVRFYNSYLKENINNIITIYGRDVNL